MRLGCGYWIKSLIFLFSSLSYANPVIPVFQQSMNNYFLSTGISQQQANENASMITKYAFSDLANQSDGRQGRFNENTTFAEYLISETTDSRINLKSNSGNHGVIYLSNMIGKSSDEEILKNIYKDEKYGNLIFIEKLPYSDSLFNRLFSFDASNNFVKGYAIAPLWYASTGMYVYRSKEPINTKNEYVFANTLMDLSVAWATNNEKEPLKDKEVYLEIPYDENEEPYKALIHREYERVIGGYDGYSQVSGGAIIKNPLNPGVAIETIINVFFDKYYFDLSKDDVDHYIKMANDNGDNGHANFDSLHEIFEGLEDMYKTKEKISKKLTTVLNRREIQYARQTLQNKSNTPIFIPIVHNKESITSVKQDYFVDNDQLAKIFTEKVNDYAKNHSDSSNSVPIPANFNLKGSQVANAVSHVTNSNQGLDLDSFMGSAKGGYRAVFSGVSVHENDDVNDDVKPQPIGGNTGTSNSTGTTGSVGGSTSETQSGTNTQTGTQSGTQTGTQTGTRTETREIDAITEAEEVFSEPVLAEIPDGFSILQPLFDLRDKLTSSFKISIPTGQCQTFEIDFFDSQLTLDSHCIILEKFAHIIMAISLIVWNILSFRIILSA
ncbi:hypothetical protein A1D23_03010 [Chelonobacter oris]|nr:hypothetical protein [Chelonobacter oris]